MTVFRRLIFALPALVLGAMDVAVFVYLPPYFAGHLGVSLAMIGAVWMSIRLIDIPIDLVLSVAMDRTRNRLGRYRPWLIIGAPLLMLALYKLFMAPHGFDSSYLILWLLVMYLGQSIIYLAHTAWTGTIATNYDDRSRLFGFVVAVSVAGTLSVLATQLVGASEVAGVQAMGWLMVGIVPLSVGLAVAMTPERVSPDHDLPRFDLGQMLAVLCKPDVLRLFFAQLTAALGPGWMGALYLFYFKLVRGFSSSQATILLAAYILAQLPGSLLTARVAGLFGKHRTFMLATTGYSLGLCSIFIIPNTANLYLTLPTMIWAGVMASAFNLMIRAMLADVADEVRLEGGKEQMSLLYAAAQLATKIAAAFAIGLTFPLLAALGFDANDGAKNTAAALDHLQIAFFFGPTVFVLLSCACLIGWRLDAHRHADIRRQLDARDAAVS